MMSYPFCHDGEMSPREPRDNSSLATATTAGCDGRDQNRLLKYNEATWLAKAFLQLAGKPLLLARWPPQFHFSFFNSRASLLLLRLKNFFAVCGGSCYLDSSNRREELWANVGKLWCSSVATAV